LDKDFKGDVMNTLYWMKLYLLTIPVFFAIDMLWLGFIARNFYKTQLGHLLSPQVNWTAAVIFYLLYIAGILFFSVRPALAAESFLLALGYGALFGLLTYGTYDLTNMATLRNWPLLVTVVDMAWGTILSASVGGAAYLIGSWLTRH
jgi:uncharacterized membrane protein